MTSTFRSIVDFHGGNEANDFEHPGYYSWSPPVGLGPPPRVDRLHPVWVCECGRPYSSHDHVCTYCGKRHDAGDIMKLPADVQKRLGPPFVDAMEDDGPLSTAYQMTPTVIGIRPEAPAPATGQYPYRYDARKMETWGKIKSHELIWGYVQASIDPWADSGINEEELAKLNLEHNDDRIVFLVLSGWALMMWRDEREWKRGQFGARNAPRPIGWWDMRKAHDIGVEQGTNPNDRCPHRIAVLTSDGVLHFRIPDEPNSQQNLTTWYNGLRGLIKEYNYQFIQSRDTKYHKEKRWPCAVGMAGMLQRGQPMGERAMAIAFHCYDIDFNCFLGVGEFMVMIEEVEAGIRHLQGLAEAADRALAMESSVSKFAGGLNDIFERAMKMRNECDKDGNGRVRKDEFMKNGQALLAQALGFQYTQRLGNPGDACTTQ